MNKHDKEIIEKLKQLPKIEDQMNKDQLYENIRMKINRSTKGKETPITNLRKKFIPIFSTALLVVIILIMLPSFINDTMLDTRESKTSDSVEPFKFENDLNKSSPPLDDKFTTQENESSQHMSQKDYTNYVIYTIDVHSTIIHRAIVEEQFQYVIPISFITTEEIDLTTKFNDLNKYFKPEEWGVRDNMFKDVIFDIDIEEQIVVVELPKDFSLGEGSAKAHAFSEMLLSMFQPYGIKTIEFNPYQGEKVDLGKFGDLSRLDVTDPVPSNYKLFRHPEADRSFLVPIKQMNISITEALTDMKADEDLGHVYQTIPNDVDFSVSSIEQELIIQFSDHAKLSNEQEFITMVEAILMTAKSFGYESVEFNNYSMNDIGPYDLSEPIKVPFGLNPIEMSE